jgi:colicin import membrane protein
MVAITAAILSSSLHANEAAHRLAEKFAGEVETKEKTPEPPLGGSSKEADRKKVEAARRAAQTKRRASAKAAEAARQAAERRRAEERDMLARARLEQEERRAAAEEASLTEEARRLINEAQRERAKAEELLAAPADAAKTAATEPQGARTDEPERRALERAEETRRLVEKLRRVRQIRDFRLVHREAEKESATVGTPPQPPALAPSALEVARAATSAAHAEDPSPPMVGLGVAAPGAAAPQAAPAAREAMGPARPGPPPASPLEPFAQTTSPPRALRRVTVLLVMVPGSYGIRRGGPRVADPVLCLREGCYISAGADRAAVFLPGRKALGFSNTWGARAGACRNALGCVFRGVELGLLPAFLQPVDLHIFKHDLRAGFAVLADSDCGIAAGRLTCRHGVNTESYTMWIVPEKLAESLGPAGLERALTEGLNGPRSALLAPR